MDNSTKRLVFFFLALFLLRTEVIGANPEICNYGNDGVYLLDSPRLRHDPGHQSVCFKNEYDVIRDRRGQSVTPGSGKQPRPTDLTGLALSGGGIKASSFHLGILSGLHKNGNNTDQSLLHEIDYISSVSGGSWANGAFWSTDESDDVLFDCLDDIATGKPDEELNAKCLPFKNLLPEAQDDIFGSRQWQKQILENFLRKRDLKFTEVLQGSPERLTRRPFPIFLATHSNTFLGQKSVKNYPFEITPLGLGTIADCLSEGTPCGMFRRWLRPLHWNNPPERGFFVDFANVDSIELKVEKYIPKTQDGVYLSHAMWSSGGLIAKVFSLHLRINPEGEKLEGVRNKYVLSDGGKADNIGLTPLVERGVDLIILSQIAGDSKIRFKDLKIAAAQAERLFGVKVDTGALTSDDKTQQPILSQACHRDGGRLITVLFIKPTPHNIDGFYMWLDKHDQYKRIKAYLEKNERNNGKLKRFPQNDTIKTKYHRNVIFGYYLLGRYISEQLLSSSLSQWRDGVRCVQR